MRGKAKLRSKLLLAVMLTAALVQGTVPLTNERVRRLGDMLKCKCGCQASITGCNMISCHFSDPVRTSLLKLIEDGKSDQEIFDEMVRVHGKDILLKPPAEGFFLMGWVMPFVGLAGGLGLLYLVLQRTRKRTAAAAGPATEVTESPDLTRYRERIEKDLSDLE